MPLFVSNDAYAQPQIDSIHVCPELLCSISLQPNKGIERGERPRAHSGRGVEAPALIKRTDMSLLHPKGKLQTTGPKNETGTKRRASTQDRAVAIISAGQCTTNALRVTKRRNGRPVDTSSNYSRKPLKAHAQACPTNALHPSHSSSDSGDSEAILAGFCSHLAVHRRDCSDIQKSVLTSPKSCLLYTSPSPRD